MTASAFAAPRTAGASGSVQRWSAVPAVLFMASIATFVQSFMALKLFFLVLFLLAAILDVARTQRFVMHLRLVAFYLAVSSAGLVWSLVGLLRPGNYVQGVLDASRLYVVWSAAFLILYSLLRSAPSLGLIHRAVVLAGILISLINFAGLADTYFGLGAIPESFRKSLELYVGIHDGYIQITSQNIGSMFLIAPYLMAVTFRPDAGEANSGLTKLSLVLSLILVAVSGRRALWLVVALTPCTIIVLSSLTGSYGLMKASSRRLLLACAGAAVAALGVVAVLPEMPKSSYIGHLQDAFSSVDERSIQKLYLIDAFKETPILGSGFGAYAGYVRNDLRPWTYELTYHKLLFNLGIVGTTFLAALFSIYLFLVIGLLRRYKAGSAIPLGLLIAFLSLLLGAYSNPYFGSFDFLFFVGLWPYLSTFEHGFERPASAQEAVA